MEWIFSENELRNTPSQKDGIAFRDELIRRSKGVNFIKAVGDQLKVPTMTLYTAAVFFHRFYMKNSLKAYHYYDIAGTSLFLATKSEETVRRIRDVAIACTKVALKNLNLIVDENNKDLHRWKETIVRDEELLLEVLGFDVDVKSPYTLIQEKLNEFGVEEDRSRKMSWNFITDSSRTPACLLFTSIQVCSGALCVAKAPALPPNVALEGENVVATVSKFLKEIGG